MHSLKSWSIVTLLIAISFAFAPGAGPSDEHGFDLANLDRTANACTDFNQFANGGWMARNPIPAAYPSWGSFNELAEKNRDVLHQILEDSAKNTNAPKGSNEQKVGDYYAACMDESAIEAAGLRPIEPEFERIEQIQNGGALQAEIERLQSFGVHSPFAVDSTQDFKNSTQVIGEIDQSGLGMPDRDYYTKDDAKSKQTREEYVKHVARMFELMGENPAAAATQTKTVMDMETKLAQASLTRVQRRDPDAVYHRMSVVQLKTLAPNLEWENYFETFGLAGKGDVNVATPDFFKELSGMLTAIPLADWKTYLRWHVINAAAPYLSSKFVDEDFNFKGKILTGTKENLPRWKRCVRYTDRGLGEALGQVYVQKTFTPEAKARAVGMVRNLEAALRADLTSLPWMGDATRKQAIAKLEAFMNKIGYPDKWRDYSALNIDRGIFVHDIWRSNSFEFKRDLNKIGKPVDRTEWGMTPPTVNAYYNPQNNEIVFPAGILQPPFYDPNADDAFNYGGMGAVIGHEMTHGFDDEGRKFDAQGNLKDWWTPEDQKNFEARSECVVHQFDGFQVEDKLHENGKLVVGESIADLGGLTVAYAAYEKSLEGKPRPKDIDGFTPEQRFFLGYARVWATNMRPEFARLLVNVDPHPLPRFRVDGPLSNMPAFSKAFSCKAGDPMARPLSDRCQIW
jgi:putative endopeptidase